MSVTEKTSSGNHMPDIRDAGTPAASAASPESAAVRITVNPSLEVIPLDEVVDGNRDSEASSASEHGFMLFWRSPHDHSMRRERALPADLLALKVILEDRDPLDTAREAGVPVALVDNAIRQAVRRGLLISPPSLIRRPASFQVAGIDQRLLSARVFTLQWHITQRCDLSCLHCYDRSARRSVRLDEGIRVIGQMRAFCLENLVQGQVSFSGGNPLLHPGFLTLYREAAEQGLATAILGNPTSRHMLSEILAIQMPAYFQVSLEGMERHNDLIRGSGHFLRTIQFLETAQELGIPTEVMLTLTRDNLDQVIPLGEALRNLTGSFAFNRLAPFGSGAGLTLPDREMYAAFLAAYLDAMRENPVLGLKDSLFNLTLEQKRLELFDGCAGYGCGAAFNFVALLPDGEIHACRKFPSPIGNINDRSLAEIYHSEIASRYREGSSECAGCSLRATCRGCPAVTAGMGGDPFTDRDPFCFRKP